MVRKQTFSKMEAMNSSELEVPGIIEGRAVQAIFTSLYTAILILGLFGNVLVCFVVVRNNTMHTVTNVFIMNLALSDILLCVLAVPFTPIYTFLGRWEFGSVMCHAVSYAQCCSVYISTLTLTSIALDRYFVIIYPFYPRMPMRTCVGIILSIWLFSAAVTVPYGYYMELLVNNVTGIELCEERWPSEQFRTIFGSVTASMQFLIPFIVIAFCYIRVSIRLNQRTKARPGTANSRKEEFKRERKKRTNRMLIAMVTIFGISWLPLNLINMTNDFFIDTVQWKYYHLSFFMAHSLAMSSTCYNPFLYAWLNEHFRKEFKLLLPCFDRQSRESTRQVSAFIFFVFEAFAY